MSQRQGVQVIARTAGDTARRLGALGLALFLAACGAPQDVASRAEVEGYGTILDAGITIPAVDPGYLQGVNRRAVVPYTGRDAPGNIVVDPHAKFLFLVLEGGEALRYPIAVGREGRGFSGSATVRRKAEWPGWTPTPNMLRSEPEVYGPFAGGVPGGVASPMGARALYLYRGGRDTFFRIHGTNEPTTIGNAGSAGCIRLFNQDIIHLYERVRNGAQVRVRTYAESVAMEGGELANRGIELAPRVVDPARIYEAAATQPAPVRSPGG
jgi:lipoprotein-anchoring transpeptidase ErfK/SrfK